MMNKPWYSLFIHQWMSVLLYSIIVIAFLEVSANLKF